jgi:hypothetical protein
MSHNSAPGADAVDAAIAGIDLNVALFQPLSWTSIIELWPKKLSGSAVVRLIQSDRELFALGPSTSAIRN